MAARAIKHFEASCPGANTNPAHGRLVEAFVSLASDVSKAGDVAKEAKSGDIGKAIEKAPSSSKADSVMQWRESAKRLAKLATEGALPPDASPQS